MSMKLYGVPGSPCVRAAMLGLTEKGIDYELVTVPPPDLKAPEHLARHPFGRMPVLDHDGFMLYETQAILRYADQAFPGPQLEPATPHETARMNQIIGIVDWYLFHAWSSGISFERLIAPRFFGRPTNEAKVEAALPEAQRCAEALESLAAAPYLTGETLTLADLHLAPHYDYFRQTPEAGTILAGKSKLARWFGEMSRRDSVKAILQH
ncbi:glutathione S-transferase [Aliidongia dinghuensis]|uniref:glutathione transferase n=1 Tax=Aliidongia dinghuensis TaxID=1867774 RepID=A0A8J2YPL1_9PROT|nr:glutathione S-transferase family protein [Aliidongia dinghuensis]GGF03098.1 glutathione S-transferase [Aliidongia dinghuensis]